MNKQLALVDFSLAKKLKEIGFDWGCSTFYCDNYKGVCKINDECLLLSTGDIFWDCNSEFNIGNKYNACELELAKQYFREVHNLNCNIDHRTHSQTYYFTITGKYQEGDSGKLIDHSYSKYKIYEEALSSALEECCEIVKNKQNG